MRFKDYLFYAMAAVLALFGLLMLLGSMMNWGKDGNPVGDAALAFFMGLLPIVTAAWLIRSISKSAKRRQREELERQVLQLASSAGGRLTPGQVAQATALTLEESRAFLDQLHLDGHCQTDVAEDGTLSYSFSS